MVIVEGFYGLLGKCLVRQLFEQWNQITGILPEVISHPLHVCSNFDEFNDINQVFAPFGDEPHVNERLNRNEPTASPPANA